jgi:hypothetical protein
LFRQLLAATNNFALREVQAIFCRAGQHQRALYRVPSSIISWGVIFWTTVSRGIVSRKSQFLR